MSVQRVLWFCKELSVCGEIHSNLKKPLFPSVMVHEHRLYQPQFAQTSGILELLSHWENLVFNQNSRFCLKTNLLWSNRCSTLETKWGRIESASEPWCVSVQCECKQTIWICGPNVELFCSWTDLFEAEVRGLIYLVPVFFNF